MTGLMRCLLPLLLAAALPAAAEAPLRIYAAASLTNALDDAALAWEGAGHAPVTLVYAASSTLAKQIEAGAPADVYASADRKWMDYLEARGRIAPGSRVDLLGNRLVLIAPAGRGVRVEVRAGFAFARAFAGKLCLGEPAAVPAGIYARQALEALGWWADLAGRIVGADDVRTALTFVERGECALGVVYATDATISDDVEVLATFPAQLHEPIVYPFARVAGARGAAAAFVDFLAHAPAAQAAFAHYGFDRLAP
jgi:molybdate transport system substrate-binding protein